MTDATKSSTGTIIPKYLILDTEQEFQELQYVTRLLPLSMIPIEDGDVYRMIMTCLVRKENAKYELEFMGLDFTQHLMDLGYGDVSKCVGDHVVALGNQVFRCLDNAGAYHNGYLVYCYTHDLQGDLVVERYTAADLAAAADLTLPPPWEDDDE